jgi:hypothetical protein
MVIGQARLQLPKMMIKLKIAHAGLRVIASHGLTGWRWLVFGYAAKKMVRQATCPSWLRSRRSRKPPNARLRIGGTWAIMGHYEICGGGWL